MKTYLAIGVAAALAAGLALPAFAQTSSAKTEISTAQAHAMMAQGAQSVKTAHTHLHHVINCIVGSKGEAFDASAGNPCKGQGDGALPDTKGNAKLQAKLHKALSDAKAGLKSSSLSVVHKDASKAAAALKATPAQKSSGGYSW